MNVEKNKQYKESKIRKTMRSDEKQGNHLHPSPLHTLLGMRLHLSSGTWYYALWYFMVYKGWFGIPWYGLVTHLF